MVGPGFHGLLPEAVEAILYLLDSQSVARLRRAAPLGLALAEAKRIELVSKVLDLLENTRFSFTHAAYVLGLNGMYYSPDTVAEKHYGIPRLLPALLCRLFRLEVADLAFTTVRVQKFAASANFGGLHRTLAFSLGPESGDEAGVESSVEGGCVASSSKGHLLCLAGGCGDGRVEICEDIDAPLWRCLAEPRQRARWVAFPANAWLQWHWPSSGALYGITVTCEPPEHCARLHKRERRAMAGIGFVLPAPEGLDAGGAEGLSSEEEEEDEPREDSRAAPSASQRRGGARAEVAKRILGLQGDPTMREVEEAYRRAVRVWHPDRGERVEEPYHRSSSASNAMAQLAWARRALLEAQAAAAAPEELLALEAPA